MKTDTEPMARSQTRPHVVIVGAGIAGLATAYYLQTRAKAANLSLSYTLVEKAPQYGGKITTHTTGGFLIEGGPDSFISQKPWARELCLELGLKDRLIGTNDAKRKTFIVHKGKLKALPDGVMLIIPTRFVPFAFSNPIFVDADGDGRWTPPGL